MGTQAQKLLVYHTKKNKWHYTISHNLIPAQQYKPIEQLIQGLMLK